MSDEERRKGGGGGGKLSKVSFNMSGQRNSRLNYDCTTAALKSVGKWS